jgi:hypothetical protein
MSRDVSTDHSAKVGRARVVLAGPQRRAGVGALLAALVLVGMMAAAARAATPPDGATLARMDRVIRDGMERSGMPGFAVAVVSGDRVVHVRGFGDAGGGRRVTPHTPFIDALIGEPVKTGTSLHRVYLYFDIAALALLAAAAWMTVQAARALRARARPRRLVVAVAGVGVRVGAALLLVALPALTLGWRPLLLWQPDLATVLALLAGLLLLSAGLRLTTLVRRARTAPDDRAEPTVSDPIHEPAALGGRTA